MNIAINSFTRGLETVSPFILSTAIEIGMRDDRVSKLVVGGLMTYQGLATTLSCRVDPFSWNNSKAALATAAIGITTTLIGVGCLAYGAWELFAPPATPIELCDERLAATLESFKQCPEARELLKEVGPFSLTCNDPSPDGAPGTYTSIDTRTISIGNEDPFPVDGLLFELHNLNQSRLLGLIAEKRCDYPMEMSANLFERCEYESAISTNRIAQKCVTAGHWPKEWDRAGDEWSTFEDYLSTQIAGGHTAHYERQWQAICQGASSTI